MPNELYCKNCDHTFIGFNSLEEALDNADHGVALMKKRQCPNNNLLDLLWNGKPIAKVTQIKESKPVSSPEEPSVVVDSTNLEESTPKSKKSKA